MNTKLKNLQSEALKQIELINSEYEQIIEKTQKNKEESIFLNISNEEIQTMYKKRKDRKYAALTVELYAIVEQLLKDTFLFYYGEEYRKEKYKKVNTILDLESKLIQYLTFKNNTKKLTNLRNYIVHNTFSFKQARNNFDIDLKPKKLFSLLIEEVKDYIANIKVK